MDAHKALINTIFNNSTLIEIPFFQRSYVWGEDLWSRFIDDMEFIIRTKKPHFFGSIILKQGRKPVSGECFADCRTVVDGQQRLTTFLIFMKVLCLKKNETTLFDYQFRLMGKEIALRHGRNDIKAFEAVMEAKDSKKIVNYVPDSKVIDAYNYFVDHISEEKFDIMTIITNTQFVRIDLDADEDEQQIFDTINSLGVNLTTSELLKNYFFSRENIREYEDKWEDVFEKDNDTKAYWDTEIETGRIRRALIDIFFDAYFQIFIQDKKYNISNEDKIMYARVDNLAQSYQHFISKYCNGDKNIVLNEMKNYASCFRKTFRPEQCESSISCLAGTERMNVIIFGLKNTTLIPYILYLTKNVEDDAKQNEICEILESYLMRRMIVRASTKNYNNLFPSLIRNKILSADALRLRLQKSTGDVTTYIPSDAELESGFENSRLINLQSKGILYLMESKIRPANSSTALLGFNNYSLEHLMPKKWRNNWSPCTSEEAVKRDTVLLTLGNLAIIPQSLNASIRDAEWTVKKNGKASKPGLGLCAAGLITLHDALGKSIWNEQEIHTRASWLYEQAKVIWKL